MNWNHLLRELFRHPPHIALQKGIKWIRRGMARAAKRKRDRLYPTFSQDLLETGALGARFPAVDVESDPGYGNLLAKLCRRYLDHRFDLLGSGWVQVHPGMRCRGVEGHVYPPVTSVRPDPGGAWLTGRINPANLEISQKIWKRLDGSYVPLDWQLDFKSGYRWSEQTWSPEIRYGTHPGADIKVPWELARGQHLPQLALACLYARRNHPGFVPPEVYLREYRNQVLDFIATNPPRYGVNWVCAMDVGIRVANWLAAYGIFINGGETFDTEFTKILTGSIQDHARHIAQNLEWDPVLRSNHYLANISGLLFAAAHLSNTAETRAWLAFSVTELVKEMDSQFLPDGGNFEASTSYHRLSLEMMLYSAALVLGLPEEETASLRHFDPHFLRLPFPAPESPLPVHSLGEGGRQTLLPGAFLERMEKAIEFTQAATGPGGQIVQIGDNDSGRFLKLNQQVMMISPREIAKRFTHLENWDKTIGDPEWLDEDVLDHRHLGAAGWAFWRREDFRKFAGSRTLEMEILSRLAGNPSLPSYKKSDAPPHSRTHRTGSEADWQDWNARLNGLPPSKKHRTEFPAPGDDLLTPLTLEAFPDFGLYVFRSDRLYLTVRLGPTGQKGYGGHAHHDQLSVEIVLDGVPLAEDPGTYLYTPLPDRRNEYRSVRAHFAPQLEGQEPGSLGNLLFYLQSNVRHRVLYFGERGFIGSHEAYGAPIYRMVELAPNRVEVTDFWEGTGVLQSGPTTQLPFSPGYGKQRARP
ncbi:MAG: heparinase [Nitrospinae bacterium CG11_big_fil_rev_8_21_14_0_20_56_8]|nr:MAG: heparinase [Nitrospinae bacterium CG11_big_fil_rev_8_21_14_0_20_56_8]